MSGTAAADHTHHHHAAASSTFGASVGVVAASYRHALYEGDYQGLVAGLTWSRGPLAAGAEITGYRLRRNGLLGHGIGDVMLHGMATAVDTGRLRAGGMLMVGLPTGRASAGLGMGHVMLMPSAWAALSLGTTTVMVTVGYGRALGGADAHAKHGGGTWPLVDPMTVSELSATAEIDHRIVPALGAGAKVATAAPLGVGDPRVFGAVRAVWIRGRFQTSAEVQVGLAGDPFGIRGVMQTSAKF